MRNELKFGLLLFALALILNEFQLIPHFLFGFLLGLSICLEVVGSMSEHTYQKLKEKKMRFFHQA